MLLDRSDGGDSAIQPRRSHQADMVEVYSRDPAGDQPREQIVGVRVAERIHHGLAGHLDVIHPGRLAATP
ncbi:MAG: hypothetical protein J0I11_02755 [Actinobacteria bacterium]|nr:hypothetical protein [Actinomycetota bacterium]